MHKDQLELVVSRYIAQGGLVKQGRTRRARGIGYFALSLKGSKHQGKATYSGTRRVAH